MKNSANLDILRACAVIAVFFAHVLQFGFPRFGDLRGLGQFGVLIFFVHTSLVLMMSMERNPGAANFYVRRFFRIYPLSALVVVIVTVLHIPPTPARPFLPFNIFNFLSNICLTMNLTYTPVALGPLWSLPLEIQMYMVLPLVFWLTKRPHALRNILLLWITFVPLAFVQPLISRRLDIIQFVPCFLGGIVAFVLLSKYRPRLNWPLWIAFIFASYGAFEIFDTQRRGWISCLIIGLAIPLFRETPVLIVRRIAAYIAEYSYGIYLFHLIAIYFCFKFLHAPMILKVLAAATATMAASAISFHLIEAPLVRCGQRVGRSLSARLAGATVQQVSPSGTNTVFAGDRAAHSRTLADEVQTCQP